MRVAPVLLAAGIGLMAIGGNFAFKAAQAAAREAKAKENHRERKFHRGGFNNAMDVEEASLILGVEPWSSEETINKAYRKLMKANHPDLGGSPLIARKINE